jgi:hypothetical protein
LYCTQRTTLIRHRCLRLYFYFTFHTIFGSKNGLLLRNKRYQLTTLSHIRTLTVVITSIISITLFMNCRKDRINTSPNAKLGFSQDTILFDTLFTTIGSTTRYFRVYNPTNEKLIISAISLEQGTQSQYRINVDGLSGVSFNDIEVPAKDSIFIFVQVTINPTAQNSPLLVEDKIKFLTNGNSQEVILHAFGQDAYFHLREIITEDTQWQNDKPHLIYGYCALDSGFTLTIPAGTKIHGYNNAILYIYKSSLHVQGSVGNEVEFKQARTENFLLAPVDSVAGQWRGIYFYAPKNSIIQYTQIRNAVIGVQIDTLNGLDSVSLVNVRIHNSVYAGVLTQGGNIFAQSSLFGNAGQFSGFFSIGGKVFIDHCTFANYWPGQRNNALFVFKDYYKDVNDNFQYRPFVQAVLKNSIIYGKNDNEFILDTLSRIYTGNVPNISMSHCLFKTEFALNTSSFYTNCWKNQDPNFQNTGFWNFKASGSAVIERGTFTVPVPDLEGTPRNITQNTLGAYN